MLCDGHVGLYTIFECDSEVTRTCFDSAVAVGSGSRANWEFTAVDFIFWAHLREHGKIPQARVASCATVVHHREACDIATVGGEATGIVAIDISHGLGVVSMSDGFLVLPYFVSRTFRHPIR